MNISLNCIVNIEKNYGNNYLILKIINLNNTKTINNILIMNNIISKEIGNINGIYNDYKLNDFPFWLYLYNKDNKHNILNNITSDYLINVF